ncbi:hypothetical protein V2H45_14455 [Tumidithrix elongata RA019]|uniref:Ferritin-like domain-containing protein n=1 Tax=Tumidithrix elongata BACA0141 TaxID=2716417 RepID=A0AAW9Q3Z7_9CYAN|nr:hypothetical protein [Tumidithrix elongata RA019]
MNALLKTPSKLDLAGYCYPRPRYLQTRARINYLVERYISLDILSERLLDLPTQFQAPHQRAWQPINWKAIGIDQIVGIDRELFLSVLAGAVEIESPIREYSKESWSYFQAMHPQMAQFMGGVRDAQGEVITVSVWEKEERQHAPVFSKIYQKLTGIKLQPKPNSVKEYCATDNPILEVYKHTLSRISTEWAAASIYLWLMAHSTGELQNAIAQPLQDEVNHLAKFWGFTSWAFNDSFTSRLRSTTGQLMGLLKHHRGERSQSDDIMRKNSLFHATELAFTFTRIMAQMYRWNGNLKAENLDWLFSELCDSSIHPNAIAAA